MVLPILTPEVEKNYLKYFTGFARIHFHFQYGLHKICSTFFILYSFMRGRLQKAGELDGREINKDQSFRFLLCVGAEPLRSWHGREGAAFLYWKFMSGY